jgi:hypothetical protein
VSQLQRGLGQILHNVGSTTPLSSGTTGPGTTGPALKVTNMNTGVGATALSLNVAPGHQPFRVNSGAKVANLNADKLDGKDSDSFAQGTDEHVSPVDLRASNGTITVRQLPGLYEFDWVCPADEFQGGTLSIKNLTSNALPTFTDNGSSVGYNDVSPSGGSVAVTLASPDRVIVQLGGVSEMTVTAVLFFHRPAGDCVAQGHVIEQLR